MWFKCFLIGLFALETIVTITMIDEQRSKITHSTACLAVIVNGLLIYGLIHYWK